MTDLSTSPLWFIFVVAAFSAVGYFAGGHLGAIEGALIAVVLAHGALLEVLREKEKAE